MVGNTRDQARFQQLLHDLVVRLALQVAQQDDGRRFLKKIRQQDVEAAFHEIGDDALRAELDNLSTLLNSIALARPEEVGVTERHFRGRSTLGTRGRKPGSDR